MYFGYLITHLGALALNLSVWNVAIYAACWLAMIIRIEEEEACLGQDARYRDYMGDVRYRLIPRLF